MVPVTLIHACMHACMEQHLVSLADVRITYASYNTVYAHRTHYTTTWYTTYLLVVLRTTVEDLLYTVCVCHYIAIDRIFFDGMRDFRHQRSQIAKMRTPSERSL